MIKIKICGLKREEDIQYANELKPDYVGFVFAKSTRQVDALKAKELIKGLDKNIKKVGVFLNAPAHEVKKIANDCDLDILQFHGDEDPTYCDSFDRTVWKAFRIKDESSLNELDQYHVDGYLLDTFVKGVYGGTGKALTWDRISRINRDKCIILAGGLTVENVGSAIKIIQPRIVDVSSGVEVDGTKDFKKMKEFIEKVRKSDEY